MTRWREDLHYYEQRAEQELERAELARDPAAARAHALLAGYYLDLVHSSVDGLMSATDTRFSSAQVTGSIT